MDVFEDYSDSAMEDSQPSQLIQNVLLGGGMDSGRKATDINCTMGDNTEVSSDSLGSSIRNSNSAPRYHYHGLAVTQSQSQHHESCGENGGSQKENINTPSTSGEMRPMLPPTTNPRQSSPHASSSKVPMKEQTPHGGQPSHPPSRVTAKKSKTMATATKPTSFHSSRATAATASIDTDIAQDKPLPIRSIPLPATRLQTVQESSQDSFAGPVSQDPEREFLAASKQFEIPLSELGRISYSQETQTTALTTDPDQSPLHRPDMFVFPSHRSGVSSTPARPNPHYDHGRVLVADTPSNSGSSQSQPSQLWQQFGQLESPDPELFSNRQPMDIVCDNEPVNGDLDTRSEASTQAYDSTPSSSYERLLAGEPEPDDKRIDQYQATQPSTQSGDNDEDKGVGADDSTSGHRAEWGTSATRNTHTTATDGKHRQWSSQAAPAPSDNSSVVPRSLRSLVDPRKKWRLHKHEGQMAAPPLFSSGNEDEGKNMASETQPSFESGIESSGRAIAGLRPQSRHEAAWPPRKRIFPPSNDTMDVVPDSEPPQGEPELITANTQPKGSEIEESAFALKVPSSPVSRQVTPAADLGEIVPDSVLMTDGDEGDDDDDTPLATLAPKRRPTLNSGRGKTKTVVNAPTGRKPLKMVPGPPVGKVKETAIIQKKALSSVARGKQKRNASATRELPQVDADTTIRDTDKQHSLEAPSPVAEQHAEKRMPPQGRSWETGEVPSSVPEQDLNPTISDPRVNAKTQKAAKSKGRQAVKLVASTTTTSSSDRKTRSRSASSNPAKKQRVSSDTDSSDDEADFIPKMEKEEEEETEPANEDDDYMDVDETETSRKRKRGKAKANSKKPKSVSRVSTRASKHLETTPVRESKRLRSATSNRTASGLATRVFALWKQDGHYYSGYIHSLVSGTRYLVKFDDDMEDEVDILRMRLNGLRFGDVVLMNAHEKATVVDTKELESSKVIGVEVHDGEGMVRMDVKLCDIRIATRTISNQWKDRVLTAETVATTVRPKSLKHTPSLSKVSMVSSTSARGVRSKALSKIGIAVTLSPGHNNWEVAKEKLLSTINNHGGTVIDDWFTVIRMDGTYTLNGKRWVIGEKEVQWTGKESLQRIFLLADDVSQKSKYLIALALGIPCLAVNWLYDYVDSGETDWQPYLLPQGCSAALEARVSQFVDLDWCNSPEHLNKIMDNKVASKVFRTKSILCLSADFIPGKPKKTASDADKAREAWSAVPRVALAMGASRVEAAVDVKSASRALTAYDYVVIKDASDLKPFLKEKGVKCVSFQWVKECLIAGQLLSFAVW